MLAALLQAVAQLERTGTAGGGGAAPAGDPAPPALPLAPAIDAALPGGGLACGALHELLGADPGAAEAIAALLLARAGNRDGRAVAWLAPDPDPYPPGLATYGLTAERLLVVTARRPADLLWAAEEALRCPALAAVAASIAGLDLAASRRLQLAAEAGGTLGLLLRPDRTPLPPTSARTRWRVAALPSAGATPWPGAPRWRLALLRCRGGRPSAWAVQWDAAAGTLDAAPLPVGEDGAGGAAAAPPAAATAPVAAAPVAAAPVAACRARRQT